MKISFPFLLAATLVFAGCGKNSSTPAQTTNTTSGSVLTAPVDYLGAVGRAQQSAVKTVDTASINQAIQMFQVDKGRNPKDLKELVDEGFMPRLPDAPYGYKLSYDATSGVVKVVKQ
ncbi:MAG: hypothetical protein EPO07_00150 [Verrucomicrobia bacterium]|nr:MAG: hypothetical protein EPO07_00150 [Verrucomicrobiota bacterium]